MCPCQSWVFPSPPNSAVAWLRSSLEVPQDGDLQTLRIYARDLPWGAADGGRHLPKDLSEMPLGDHDVFYKQQDELEHQDANVYQSWIAILIYLHNSTYRCVSIPYLVTL